jgi:O-antigen ligase
MVPLEVLAEEGLVGFGMWLLIFFVALTQLRLIRKPMFQHSEAKKAFLTIFACLIFSTLLSFKQGSLISFSIPFVFVALQERLIALRKYNR